MVLSFGCKNLRKSSTRAVQIDESALRLTLHFPNCKADLMETTLAATALLMGLAGGPHCVAMCGAACAGIGMAGHPPVGVAVSGTSSAASGAARAAHITRSLWIFQIGRVLGYSALGGLAAASMQGLGWLSAQSAVLRPVWTLFHVAAALLGLVLLWQARQPLWLENSGRKVWHGVRTATSGMHRGAAPLVMGVLWSLLPCGLLYSALLVAALSSQPLEGAMVMALFALGSGVSLMAGPWLWFRLKPKPFEPVVSFLRRKEQHKGPHEVQRHDDGASWAIRIAGLALFASSGWALWMGLVHDTAPWCITP